MLQFLNGLKANNINACVFDELKQSNFLDVFKEKSFNLLIGYDFSALKFKVENKLDIRCINYFADVIKDSHSGIDWEQYYPYLNEKSNFNFYWDKALCEKNSEIKFLKHQPLFVDCNTYRNLNLKKDNDILFAGRLDTEKRLELFTNIMKTFDGLNFGWYAIEKHFKDALNRTTEKDLIKKAYKGFLETPEDLVVVINSTKIVINENSQGISSLNFRTIESMACETIVLSDYRTEMNAFKGDLPFYLNTEDLISKINYYLENPEAYDFTVKNCRKHVELNHNAKIEILKLINSLQ